MSDRTFLIEYATHEGRIRRWDGMRIERVSFDFAVRRLRWYEFVMPWRWSRKSRTVLSVADVRFVQEKVGPPPSSKMSADRESTAPEQVQPQGVGDTYVNGKSGVMEENKG